MTFKEQLEALETFYSNESSAINALERFHDRAENAIKGHTLIDLQSCPIMVADKVGPSMIREPKSQSSAKSVKVSAPITAPSLHKLRESADLLVSMFAGVLQAPAVIPRQHVLATDVIAPVSPAEAKDEISGRALKVASEAMNLQQVQAPHKPAAPLDVRANNSAEQRLDAMDYRLKQTKYMIEQLVQQKNLAPLMQTVNHSQLVPVQLPQRFQVMLT